jgi:hypothetical protein
MKKYSSHIYKLLSLAFLLKLNTATYAQCGTERWPVKILQDAEAGSITFTPITSTVQKQLAFTKPTYHNDNPRDATEKKVYKINCILIMYRAETDKDWHLIIQDRATNKQMVAEIPDPGCVDMSNTHFSKLIVSRNRLKAKVGPVTGTYRAAPSGTKLQIIGVGFFDKDNHPIGFKGREIHPVLELKVL